MTALEQRVEKAKILAETISATNCVTRPESVAVSAEVPNTAITNGLPPLEQLYKGEGFRPRKHYAGAIDRAAPPTAKSSLHWPAFAGPPLTPPSVQTSIEDTEDLDNPYDVSGDFGWDESSAESPTLALEYAGSNSPMKPNSLVTAWRHLLLMVAGGLYDCGIWCCLASSHRSGAAQLSQASRALRSGTKRLEQNTHAGLIQAASHNALVDAYFRHYHLSYPILMNRPSAHNTTKSWNDRVDPAGTSWHTLSPPPRHRSPRAPTRRLTTLSS
ncbi:hypothetical protein Q7P35_009806 [Cladosporium inversicolor]